MAMSANLRASLLMAASMAGFTFNDALIKSLGGAIGTGQVMLVRGAIMLVFLLIFMRLTGIPLLPRTIFSGPVLLRTASEIGATLSFLYALFHLPIANVSAVLQALPLTVTLGAALFLGEPVGLRRILAIVIGFAGVLLIVRPGFEGFNIYTLSVLVTVLFAAVRDLATRRIAGHIPSLTISLFSTIAVSAAGSAIMLFQGGWRPMAAGTLLTLSGAAIFLFIGYQCIVLAMRSGEIHVVAPFRYTSLLWAILLGLVVFSEVPDGLTLVGAAIVVVTGLYTLYRERVVSTTSASANISAASAPPGRGT
jgi:drug/metabolite transporter (DMT)-like permease